MRLTLIIFIISFQCSFSQKTFDTQRDTNTNIYLHSLEEYFNSVDKSISENNNEYYIEKSFVHLDSFPKTINGFKINWVKEVNIDVILKSSNTNFINLMINPIQVNKQTFYINIIPFYANSKYNNYKISNGIFVFQYEYDSKLNGLIYKKFVKE